MLKMARKNAVSFLIEDCVTIKLTNQSDYYQSYFKYKGYVDRRTTNTKNKQEAAKIAYDRFQKITYEIDNDLFNNSVNFKRLSEKYLKSIVSEKKHKFHAETIQRHFFGFFSRFKSVADIKISDLEDYLVCRRSKKAVQNSTINKENAVFNAMMSYALKHQFIKHEIKFDKQKEELNPRPHFTGDQYRTLLKTAKKRIRQYQNLEGQEKGLCTMTLSSRLLARDIIELVVDTALRPCELKTIKWKDVDLKRRTIKLNNAGKVKSSRLLFIRTKAGLDALQRMKQRRINCIREEDLYEDVINNEYIQSNIKGERIISLKKAITNIIKDCNFEYEAGELKHAMYSLRHTYATFALTGRKGKRIGVGILAKQMGTSIKMIEQHYGHDTTEDYKDILVN